jgi:hypothetical protein
MRVPAGAARVEQHPGMASSPEQRIQAHAAKQLQLVTRAQAYAAGLSPRQVAYRVQTGRWKQVRRDVFAVNGRAPASWEAVVLAVVLGVPGSVASHGTALWLLGVPRLGKPDVVEISAPNGCRMQLHGVVVHQHRHLGAEDRTTVGDVPVTTGERTIIDLAGTLELGERLGVLEDAILHRAARRVVFVRRARACTVGRAGLAVLIEAAGDEGADRFRSWLEGQAARTWAAAGLPEPTWNVVLRDGRGRIGEIDAVFPGGIVTVELDGLRFHCTPAQRRKDKARDRRLALSGRLPLRFDWEDVVLRPDAMVAEIGDALRLQAAACGAPRS